MNFNLDMSNMFGVKKKAEEKDKLLGEVTSSPEELAGGTTGNIQPTAMQPMSDDTTPTGTTVPVDRPVRTGTYVDPVEAGGGFESDPNKAGIIGPANTVYNEPSGSLVPGVTGELPPDTLGTGLGGTGMVDPGKPELPGYTPPPAARKPMYYEDAYIDPLVGDVRGRAQDDYTRRLQNIATGKEMSPVVQQQMERAQQSALAAAASARGMPVSATQRMLQSGLSEAGRVGMETAAAQQTEYANMVNQLEGQRDQTVANLISQGVDRDKAVLDANTKLQLQLKDLQSKTFLGKLGSVTEILKTGIEHASFGESGSENVAEEAALLNLVMGAAGPAGIDAPMQKILTSKQQDPDAQFFVQTLLPDGSQGQGSMK